MVTLVVTTDAPAVLGSAQGRWTYADWERLSDDSNRYEIIDGVLYMTTAPSSFHQWIVSRLWRYVGIPAEDQGLAYAFDAPIGVIMPGCDPVQPDYVIVLRSRASIFRDGRIKGVPDLLVEILSPGNTAYDQEIKLAAYQRAGVPEYMVIDPRARTVAYFRLNAAGLYTDPQLLGADDSVRIACLPAITFQVGTLFAGAPDTSL